jgi:hypothetical protein
LDTKKPQTDAWGFAIGAKEAEITFSVTDGDAAHANEGTAAVQDYAEDAGLSQSNATVRRFLH